MAVQTVSPGKENPLLSYLSLFNSLGTLLCCALPSLLVLLGVGATVASLLSAAPWLVILSRHKNWVFAISGALIGSTFLYVHSLSPRLKARGQACSIEQGPTACDTATQISRIALWLAVVVYAVGFFTAYLLAPILNRL
jgi:hypothetical protein